MSKTVGKTSLAEAFMQFQTVIIRKEIQYFKEELGQLEDKKQRLTALQEHLREEQARHSREQRKRLKELEGNLEKKQQEDEERLKQTIQDNLELKQKHEKELEELRVKLARLQVEVEEQNAERQARLQYKNEDSIKNQQKIQKLEKWIDLSQTTFQDISEHFQRSLDVAKEENEQKIAQSFVNKTQRTTKIIQCTVPCQVPLYIKKVAVLESTVQKLQEENLEHVNTLFRIIDSPISPGNEFTVQSASFGSHDTQSVDENMTKISLEETSDLVNRRLYPQTLAEAEETRQESDVTASRSTTPPIRVMSSSQANFMGPIHLALEKERLLCVRGKACSLHPLPEQTEQWTVTTKIIKAKFQNPGKI